MEDPVMIGRPRVVITSQGVVQYFRNQIERNDRDAGVREMPQVQLY
jgi:hypothetical protein